MVSRKSYCRRLQFNLRFLFYVTLIVAGLAYWYRQIEVARQELIAEIQSLGGKVTVEPSGWLPSNPGARVTDVTLPHSKTATFDLERLRVFPALTQLHLTDFHCESHNGAFSASHMSLKVDIIDLSLNELRPKISR